MQTFSIRLFGAFRSLDQDSRISIEAKVPIRVSALKELLNQEIQRRTSAAALPDLSLLVSDSALATDLCVLSSTDSLERGCSLALLPPVCGG
jgi:molybdopterin converting factor small subunit